MIIKVRVLVMNPFWWVMQFSWVSPMYMLLSSVWLSPVHLSHVNLILRDKAGRAEGNVFFPQRGMCWTCGRSACLDPAENYCAYWCAHMCTHTHTHSNFLWMGHTTNSSPLSPKPPSSPSASPGPSLPILSTHMRGPAELSLGGWALSWGVSQGIPGSSF